MSLWLSPDWQIALVWGSLDHAAGEDDQYDSQGEVSVSCHLKIYQILYLNNCFVGMIENN